MRMELRNIIKDLGKMTNPYIEDLVEQLNLLLDRIIQDLRDGKIENIDIHDSLPGCPYSILPIADITPQETAEILHERDKRETILQILYKPKEEVYNKDWTKTPTVKDTLNRFRNEREKR